MAALAELLSVLLSLAPPCGAQGPSLPGAWDAARAGAVRFQDSRRSREDGESEKLSRVEDILSRGGAPTPAEREVLERDFPGLFARGLVGRAPSREERALMERLMPGLGEKGDFRISGEADERYNCIAWAMGRADRFLWPRRDGREAFEEADFDALLDEHGFIPAPEGTDPEKADVVLYCKTGEEMTSVDRAMSRRPDGSVPDRVFTHASRRIAGGFWESKHNSNQRMIHRLAEMEGSPEAPSIYGRACKSYLAKPVE